MIPEELDKDEPWRDPIVKEDRKNGQRIFEEAGGTIESYLAYLVKVGKASGHPVWQGKAAAAVKEGPGEYGTSHDA